MWALILFSLLLGCLFLYLAVRSFLRRQEWRNAVRLNARVAEVQYREVRRKGNIIDDGRSSAVVTLRFFYEGREWTEQKEYQGIVGTPTCGQTVPICLNQGNQTWAPWREVRSYWGLLLALSVLCLQITAALLIDGRGILAALSDPGDDWGDPRRLCLCLRVGPAAIRRAPDPCPDLLGRQRRPWTAGACGGAVRRRDLQGDRG